MKICGVVSEFNPFHNGHKYLFDKIREYGFDAIVCVMSGSFVQRGEYASFDKKIRAEAAVFGGADLVLSLPFPWSSSTAELFSRGAVSILNNLGCVDTIAFGSECGDITKLKSCADFLLSISQEEIKAFQKEFPNMPFAEIRQAITCDKLGKEVSDLLRNPNDILAIEYIKAIMFLDSNLSFLPIKRFNSSHDGNIVMDNICSSSYIREMLSSDRKSECFDYLPENTRMQLLYHNKVDTKAYFHLLCGAILSCDPGGLSEIAEIGGGFEYAIYKELLVSKDYDNLISSLKSRHLTDAKIRRALLFASTGVKKNDFLQLPAFTEVLACNKTGKEILSSIRHSANVDIISKVGNIKNASEESKRQFKLQRKAEIMFEKL